MLSMCVDVRPVPVLAIVRQFPGHHAANEYHLTLVPTDYGSFEQQLQWLKDSYHRVLNSVGLTENTAVLRRFFCSDIVNQTRQFQAFSFSNSAGSENCCAVSWVGQPPAGPAKIALWAYHIQDQIKPLEKQCSDDSVMVKRGAMTHIWTTGIHHCQHHTSYDQTAALFKQYHAFLQLQGLSFKENLIRTWLFVQNVDVNYQGLVLARRELFTHHGLTAQTHYIASTGIEGAGPDSKTIVTLDAYAIAGIKNEQVHYISAPDYLCPTQIYGVTFERATAVAYQDRKHIFISGTASIDRQGEIVYPGDILRQFNRTFDNIAVLLDRAGATPADMGIILVYVRDTADLPVVQHQMKERFGDIPSVVVAAKVCRPGWLIEAEAIAIIPEKQPELPCF